MSNTFTKCLGFDSMNYLIICLQQSRWTYLMNPEICSHRVATNECVLGVPSTIVYQIMNQLTISFTKTK